MRNLRRPGAVGIAVQARIARRATTAARSRLLWKLGLGGVAVLGALGLWRTARITTTQHPRGGEKVVDLPPPATVPVVVDAAPPSKAADDTECPQTKSASRRCCCVCVACACVLRACACVRACVRACCVRIR